MIPFEAIKKLFSFDTEGKYCIEIEFSIRECPKYSSCWMGKLPDKDDPTKEIYWYGLVHDGSEAYGYDNFQDFSHAPVFGGRSLKEVWENVELLAIDGCDPEERLRVYLE